MRSRRNYRLEVQQAQGHAQRLLSHVLGDKFGVRCTAAVVWRVVLLAAARTLSLFSACLQLGQISGQAVRSHLRASLPKCRKRLEKKLNEALLEPLPKKTRQRRRVVAIDVHEIPYHGDAKKNDVVHKKPRQGTTKFFAYATACLVEQGHRYTLGFTWVRGKEGGVHILQRLLPLIEASGVKIRRLLLDRGFFNVAVMNWLQGQNVPFVMPVVFRGRKPSRGKAPTGVRAFLRNGAGW